MINNYLKLIIFTILLSTGNGANILGIFPTASFSHQQPLLAISRALAAKGHKLTVITTNPSKPPIKNHRDVDISFMYDIFRNMSKNIEMDFQTRISAIQIVQNLPNFFEYLFISTMNSPEMQAFIKEINGTTYDLILFESLNYSGYLGFSELVGNPPIIGIITTHPSSTGDAMTGNPSLPSYIPSLILPHEHRMSFTERMANFLMHCYMEYTRIRYLDPLNERMLTRYFGAVKHTAYELERNVSLVIASADLATGYPRPVNPNTVFVGPLHIQQQIPALPQEIQKWMDESEDGVVYFSLGSNMKGTSVPAEKRAAFIKAFSQFPTFRVLWKWESDDKLPGQPDNVLTRKWLPQQSVLAHPKTRLFISQCGLQSLQEATTFGVPMMAIPMFGDQDYNAMKVAEAKAGIVVEFADINYQVVYETLNKLLKDSSYKENMMRLSKITNDKPMPALETAVWWVEYVLRHSGAPHLTPVSLELYWFQYLCLDVIAALLLAAAIPLAVVYYLLKILISKFVHKKVKTN
nr:UDP-glucuronosyltransferase [Nilaparvata lugens]